MLLVIDMLCWVGVGKEVFIGKYAGQSKEGQVAYRDMPEHFISV